MSHGAKQRFKVLYGSARCAWVATFDKREREAGKSGTYRDSILGQGQVSMPRLRVPIACLLAPGGSELRRETRVMEEGAASVSDTDQGQDQR